MHRHGCATITHRVASVPAESTLTSNAACACVMRVPHVDASCEQHSCTTEVQLCTVPHTYTEV
eukprot:354742-Chlamydomonas_euryale.AAC.3